MPRLVQFKKAQQTGTAPFNMDLYTMAAVERHALRDTIQEYDSHVALNDDPLQHALTDPNHYQQAMEMEFTSGLGDADADSAVRGLELQRAIEIARQQAAVYMSKASASHAMISQVYTKREKMRLARAAMAYRKLAKDVVANAIDPTNRPQRFFEDPNYGKPYVGYGPHSNSPLVRLPSGEWGGGSCAKSPVDGSCMDASALNGFEEELQDPSYWNQTMEMGMGMGVIRRPLTPPPQSHVKVSIPEPVKPSTVYAVVGLSVVAVLGSIAAWAYFSGKKK